ncbi:hypothetical protein LTR56_024516 [Elasticomyces elasticus]|nr:hypothetical protein LTR22_026711 [Elasticomyces elasticus]KAK3618630.1 hypothetical protein LTR56_024516 [Elasticomyces elasticus]KAK4901036.1 hypothetical protein LTR49_027358 [Elasticomyces elasticus]
MFKELASALATPFLGRVVEICIVTPDLKSTLMGLVRSGVGPFRIFHFRPHTVSNQEIYGKPATFEIDVAFADTNEIPGSNGSKRGIQHVAFDCTEIHSATKDEQRPLLGDNVYTEAAEQRKEFESRGFPLAQNGVWKGRKGVYVFQFFDTTTAVKTCLETIVFYDDWEASDGFEELPA